MLVVCLQKIQTNQLSVIEKNYACQATAIYTTLHTWDNFLPCAE
jgi:hypothetical protein